MKKYLIYEAGAGVGLMTAGLAALAISHGNMPWQRDVTKPTAVASPSSSHHAESAAAKLPPIVNTLMDNHTQSLVRHENKEIDTGAEIIIGVGFIATSLAIVSALDIFPEDRKRISVSPVDLPMQQGSADVESIRVA